MGLTTWMRDSLQETILQLFYAEICKAGERRRMEQQTQTSNRNETKAMAPISQIQRNPRDEDVVDLVEVFYCFWTTGGRSFSVWCWGQGIAFGVTKFL